MQPTRSAFLTAATMLLAAAPALASIESEADPDSPAAMSPQEAMHRLVEGNARYTAGSMQHPRQNAARRREVAPKQTPFAVVLDCADSRVPPEIVFDQGLGDLFVCRVAGNFADPAITGSIEYAVAHFNTPLVVVLGHDRCGAAAATLDTADTRLMPPASIAAVVSAILPYAKPASSGAQRLSETIDANARAVAKALAMSPVIHPKIATGGIQVVAARYAFESGHVKFLG